MNLTSLEERDTSVQSSGDKIGINFQIQIPRWLSRYLKTNKKTLTMLGLLIGAMFITISIQHPVSAQMFDKVQNDADKIQSFLPDLADGLEFIVETARLLFFGVFFVGAAGAGFSFITNRGWEVWFVIAVVFGVLGGLSYAAETMVYG